MCKEFFYFPAGSVFVLIQGVGARPLTHTERFPMIRRKFSTTFFLLFFLADIVTNAEGPSDCFRLTQFSKK